jgi:cytochrome c oxidase subunit IV
MIIVGHPICRELTLLYVINSNTKLVNSLQIEGHLRVSLILAILQQQQFG